MKFILLIAMFLLTSVLTVSASAACGPPKCPVNSPADPLQPSPLPGPAKAAKVIGYFEVASPDCAPEDHVRAMEGAQQLALHEAEQRLGTAQIIPVKPMWYSSSCGQSIYAGSFKGNSWIVQAFGEFRR